MWLYLLERNNAKSFVLSECGDAMLNCTECSAYNLCTACDGDLVVNATSNGCTGKIPVNIQKYLTKWWEMSFTMCLYMYQYMWSNIKLG